MKIEPKDVVVGAVMIIGAVILARVIVGGVTYGLQHITIEEERTQEEAEAPQDLSGGDSFDQYPQDEGNTLEQERSEEILKEKAEKKTLNIEIMENRPGELVFQIGMDEFIDSFNGCYWADKGERYLLPSWQWRSYVYDKSVHSSHKTCRYHYSRDESILPLPTITVYAPSNADYIQEITVNYDAHSSFDQMYAIYEELCYYTLKVMFPDISDDQIRELYTTLNGLAFEHDTNIKYTSESVPCALYYRGNIGLYPYFAWGEDVHLCIIPVTQARIEEMRGKGVKIYGF